jgi:hypothetical protein
VQYNTYDNNVNRVNTVFFPPLAHRPDSGSCFPLTGLRDHTHWTRHIP